nr:protein kinase superfamily protein [Tanacetum cinerariifolium]
MSMRASVVPAITSTHPPEPFMEPSTVPRHLLLLQFKAMLLVLLLPGNDIAIIFVMGKSLMNLSIFIPCT